MPPKTKWTRKKKTKLVKEKASPVKEVPEVEDTVQEHEKEANETVDDTNEAVEDQQNDDKNEDTTEANPVEDDEQEVEQENEDINSGEGLQEEEKEQETNPVEHNEEEVQQENEEINSGEGLHTNEEGDEGSERTLSEIREAPDSDDGALKPLGMYFPPTEYKKKIKVSTRCYVAEVLKTLEELDPPMNRLEKSYFDNHRQFKHILHMPKDENHKVMGMWMLLLRTARIEKEKEVWFVVNGCPIRYGIREHALISGLNCKNYPLNYKKSGGMNFVKKYFGTGIVRYQDVKAKVQEGMEPSRDRLRLLVLYFLSSIILGQRKTGKDAPSVDEFLLRAVDDLNLCSTFPWGRLSFDYMLKQISHTMAHFGGNVKEDVIWPIPGFCIPMELLAFEAIKELRVSFRDSVQGVDPTCPRMCKSKFKRGEMKGFQLSKINKELGNTKDIENILSVTEEEQSLLDRITEPEDVMDKDDVIVESWMKRFYCGDVVRFEDMLEEDVTAREAPIPDNGGTETRAETGATNEGASMMVKMNELVELFNSFKEDVGERMKNIEEKVGEFGEKVGEFGEKVGEFGEKVGDFDSRLAAAEARNADVEEEERPTKRPKRTKK